MKKMIEENLKNAFQVLALAIKSEIEAVNVYSELHDQVKNELLKKKLKFLIYEEKKHKRILERLYSQRFPQRKLELPEKSFLPPINLTLDSKASILDLFKAALKAEKISEDFYKEVGSKAEGKESRRILEYLSRVERSHYFMIKSEIDLLDKYPDYYDVEDFHLGQDLFHLGP